MSFPEWLEYLGCLYSAVQESYEDAKYLCCIKREGFAKSAGVGSLFKEYFSNSLLTIISPSFTRNTFRHQSKILKVSELLSQHQKVTLCRQWHGICTIQDVNKIKALPPYKLEQALPFNHYITVLNLTFSKGEIGSDMALLGCRMEEIIL